MATKVGVTTSTVVLATVTRRGVTKLAVTQPITPSGTGSGATYILFLLA